MVFNVLEHSSHVCCCLFCAHCMPRSKFDWSAGALESSNRGASLNLNRFPLAKHSEKGPATRAATRHHSEARISRTREFCCPSWVPAFLNGSCAPRNPITVAEATRRAASQARPKARLQSVSPMHNMCTHHGQPGNREMEMLRHHLVDNDSYFRFRPQ